MFTANGNANKVTNGNRLFQKDQDAALHADPEYQREATLKSLRAHIQVGAHQPYSCPVHW